MDFSLGGVYQNIGSLKVLGISNFHLTILWACFRTIFKTREGLPVNKKLLWISKPSKKNRFYSSYIH